MGVFGACRRDELVKMTIKDIEDKDSLSFISFIIYNDPVVQVPDTKTNKSRVFTDSNNRDE
jgi:hypothetical protein